MTFKNTGAIRMTETKLKEHMTKGKTKWYPRHIYPVRNGLYECRVRIMGGLIGLWSLEWDSKGFRVPFPMNVYEWRGQTKKAARGQA